MTTLSTIINTQNVEMNTSIHCAVLSGKFSTLKVFYDKAHSQCDLTITNINGRTPLDLANHLKNSEMVALLEKWATEQG